MARVYAVDDGLPVDPDVTFQAGPFAARERGRAARGRLDIVGVIFLGGCLGGATRYAVVRAWPTHPTAFPWPVLAVNLAGAFMLALLLVIAAHARHSRYLRPLVGTGFCGALTTFASVVVSADEMFSHGAPGLAAAYLLASVAGGLAAAGGGLMLARGVRRVRRHRRTQGAI